MIIRCASNRLLGGSRSRGQFVAKSYRLWRFLIPYYCGLRRGEIFWLCLNTTSVQCLRLTGRFYSLAFVLWLLLSGKNKPVLLLLQ